MFGSFLDGAQMNIGSLGILWAATGYWLDKKVGRWFGLQVEIQR